MRRVLAITLFISLAFWASMAMASTVTFNLDTTFSDKPNPPGNSPWLKAEFSDGSGIYAGQVFLTLTANLSPGSFVSDWGFSFNPSLTVSNLSFLYKAGSSTGPFAGTPRIGNEHLPGTNTYFDFLLSFSTSNKGNRFDGNEYVVYLLGYKGGSISASDFSIFNLTEQNTKHKDQGSWLTAAHIQGLSGKDGSTAIGAQNAVPIPSAVWLFGSGLLGISGFRRVFPG